MMFGAKLITFREATAVPIAVGKRKKSNTKAVIGFTRGSVTRGARWQRRWFVLYDDGELTYSVDEHPETIPQAIIDMTKVLEVSTADAITSHPHSIAITAPERVTFVKGTCPEETKWWYNVLVAFPKSKGRHKRNATFPGGQATAILQAQSKLFSICGHILQPAVERDGEVASRLRDPGALQSVMGSLLAVAYKFGRLAHATYVLLLLLLLLTLTHAAIWVFMMQMIGAEGHLARHHQTPDE
ncbi:hypothetical protein AND_006343 [Anopheles darlingi]|uniref:PH domain-containing protein n=1 Tax=Anopheles darlingi TaxID=43151 RepID=W5JGF5_ANODA|nr:hypothetical protein AND_006343 [Anopheles darlingi]